MKCGNHATMEAVANCAECGKPLCGECAVELGARFWCRECLVKIVEQAQAGRGLGKRRPSKLAAALLSIIPGAGHMYLGLIGKGFALMGLLIASIFLTILYSDSTGMYWMTAYLIPTLSVLFLSYAIFDSMEIADELKSGGSYSASPGDPAMSRIWERVLMNPRTGGYLLLVAGIVGVLNLFEVPISRLMLTYLSVEFSITGLVIPVILMIIGICLLRKGRGAR